MTQPNCSKPVAALFGRGLLAAAIALIGTSAHAAETPAAALSKLDADTLVTRSLTLRDLGVSAPVVLNRLDSRREFYLPVPPHVDLRHASVAFASRYLRADPGNSSLMLSIDGVPADSRGVTDARGDVNTDLPVGAAARSSGFVRLSVDWSSRSAYRFCETPGASNVLTIDPGTRLTYSYDSASLTTLEDAWSALPRQAVLLVSGRTLGREAFDAAWRVGVALDRAGKYTVVRALPAIGDTVDTRGLEVPEGLAAIPAFAALGHGAEHKLDNAAELGALIVLGAPAASGDLAIADTALQTRLTEALDALGQQFAGDAASASAYAKWRARHATLASQRTGAKQIGLANLANRPMIAVAPQAGAQAAGLFDNFWRKILTTPQVSAETARLPAAEDGAVIPVANFGAQNTSFDVLARGDWSANFTLNSAFINGRMPNELVLDVAAAPGASTTRPVVSAFLNDVLIGAMQMNADGKPERLSARLPGYALAVNNVLRVSFQRQPVSVDCNELPQAFPVDVLPSTFLRAGSPEPDGTFVGLLPLMSAAPALIVPASYLTDSAPNITRVVRMATAAGVSPLTAELVVANAGQAVKPAKPFLAMDVQLDGLTPKATIDSTGHLEINDRRARWLDVTGLAQLGVAEVARSAGQDGMLWHGMGGPLVELNEPFLLNRGDVAVIGQRGPVAWIDSSNPDASRPPGAGESAFFEWRRYLSWGVPAISLGLLAFLLLLIVAYRVGRRRRTVK
jgi:hypothetical protein